MNVYKEQLYLKYPFLRKTGIIHMSTPFDIAELAEKWRDERILVLMVGVQGCGKTTYCKEHFSEYPVINLDDILIDYLDKNRVMLTEEVSGKINMIFLSLLSDTLKNKGIAIVDAGSLNLYFRVMLLNLMKKYYTKVVLVVLNLPKGRIIRQINGQIELRDRPGLFEDVSMEYELLQKQIKHHFLEMGVDEVYML